MHPFVRHRSRRLTLVLCIALAVLLAQGWRICVHPWASAGTSDAAVTDQLTHLESVPHTDDSAGDTNPHVPLFPTLVKFTSDVPFVFLVTVLFLFGVVRRPTYLRHKLDVSLVTNGSCSLRPPLRAPPL